MLTGEVSSTSAIPWSSVTALAADKVPAVVSKFTVFPETGLLFVSVTTARIVVLLAPSAGRLDAPAVTLTEPTTTAAAFTVMVVVPFCPLLWAVAVIVSVPVSSPAVYVIAASPFTLVTADAADRAAPLAFVVTANETVSPTTTLPLASVTVAVRVDEPFGLTVVGTAETTTDVGGPATNETFAESTKPLATAVIVAVPMVVPAKSSTSAIPLSSVTADAVVPPPVRVPSVVSKSTVMPGAGWPLMSFTVALIMTESEPFAVMLPAPDAISMDPTITAAACTEMSTVSLIPVLLADVTVMVSVTPVVFPAVYVKPASPFTSVTAEATDKTPPLLFCTVM